MISFFLDRVRKRLILNHSSWLRALILLGPLPLLQRNPLTTFDVLPKTPPYVPSAQKLLFG